MRSKFVLGDGEPPIKWQAPWEYADWRIAACKDEDADEALLQALYVEQWDPVEAYKAMLHSGRFKRQAPVKKSRHIILDKETAEKRIAKAAWIECSRLLFRRMTPEARALVLEMQVSMEKIAGIEVFGRS